MKQAQESGLRCQGSERNVCWVPSVLTENLLTCLSPLFCADRATAGQVFVSFWACSCSHEETSEQVLAQPLCRAKGKAVPWG